MVQFRQVFAQLGKGADNSMSLPLCGWANPIFAACRKLRPSGGSVVRPTCNWPAAPYNVSPTTGWRSAEHKV